VDEQAVLVGMERLTMESKKQPSHAGDVAAAGAEAAERGHDA